MASQNKPDPRAAAEARRQKILASRGNRLAKLTNTARGAEGGGVFDNDAPLAAFGSADAKANFLGEDEPPQLPPVRRQTSGGAISAGASRSQGSSPVPRFDPTTMGAVSSPLGALMDPSAISNDPLAVMMQALASGSAPTMANVQQDLTLPPRSRVSHWLPFVHGISIICTVLYAAIILEPNTWRRSTGLWQSDSRLTAWDRWKPLVSGRNALSDLQTVPVFYIFLALQLALHSFRLVLEHKIPPPPGIVASVLPYLPPRFQLYITGGMKYITIGQQFLDDLGLLVFILGVLVWLANF